MYSLAHHDMLRRGRYGPRGKRTSVGRPPQRFYEFTPLVAVSGQSKTWLNAKGS